MADQKQPIKTFEFTRLSTPENPQRGYGDILNVYKGTETIGAFEVSTCPNPFQPSTKKSWKEVYVMVDYGEMAGTVCVHKTYGKCILINNGNKVPTINENSNHNNEKFATEVFFHAGGGIKERTWRGSKCCFTADPEVFACVMDLVDVGEKVVVELIHNGGAA